MLFELSNPNSNLVLTLGYLNPALNNSAPGITVTSQEKSKTKAMRNLRGKQSALRSMLNYHFREKFTFLLSILRSHFKAKIRSKANKLTRARIGKKGLFGKQSVIVKFELNQTIEKFWAPVSAANVDLCHMTRFSLYLSLTALYFCKKISSFLSFSSIRIVLDCFYLPIFHFEIFLTWACRLL